MMNFPEGEMTQDQQLTQVLK